MTGVKTAPTIGTLGIPVLVPSPKSNLVKASMEGRRPLSVPLTLVGSPNRLIPRDTDLDLDPT